MACGALFVLIIFLLIVGSPVVEFQFQILDKRAGNKPCPILFISGDLISVCERR
jgi:hypothetical protein